MICKNCQKEIDNDSKFCEFCGSKTNKNYRELVDRILKEKQSKEDCETSNTEVKKRKYLYFFKNTILILCVYVLSAYIISLSFDKYTPTEVSFIFAIPTTILVVFIYNKLARKFNL